MNTGAVADRPGVAATAAANGSTVKPNPVTSYAVGNDHVVCNTLTGTLAFATALKIPGDTSAPETSTIKGTVNGCTDSDNANVGLFSGTITATINSTGTDCTALFGSSANSGSMTIVWKPAKGQAFTPVDPSTLKATSKLHTNGQVGGFFTIADDNDAGEARGPAMPTVRSRWAPNTVAPRCPAAPSTSPVASRASAGR
jgi:hypothetical protein